MLQRTSLRNVLGLGVFVLFSAALVRLYNYLTLSQAVNLSPTLRLLPFVAGALCVAAWANRYAFATRASRPVVFGLRIALVVLVAAVFYLAGILANSHVDTLG